MYIVFGRQRWNNISFSVKNIQYTVMELTINSIAGIGPVPIILGSTPLWAIATIWAKGFISLLIASSFVIRTTAAAPSFIPDALPAVTVPLG